MSPAETLNSYGGREEMASCITEISHDYDFPRVQSHYPCRTNSDTGHADIAKVWKVTLA